MESIIACFRALLVKIRTAVPKLAALLIASILLLPSVTYAQGAAKIQAGMKSAASVAGLDKGEDLEAVIGQLINGALGLIGVLLLVYLLYGGFMWMTAGESDRVKKAQSIIKNAITGMIIIILSYSVANYILNLIVQATSATGGGTVSSNP